MSRMNAPHRSDWADSDDSDTGDTARLIGDKRITTYDAVEEHERGLDKLGEALKRQKNAAHSLATEVDLHNEILEDIDQGLLATNENLAKNTRNIKLLLRKSSTFSLWLIIILLGIVIVLLFIF